MRLITVILVLAFVAAGITFGALNADMVGYDLGMTHIELPKGAALLAALLLGWLFGGLTAWVGSRSRRGRARKIKAAGVDNA